MKDSFLNNKRKRIIFIGFAFLLLYFVSFVIDPYAVYWETYFQRPWSELLSEWLTSFGFCFLISEFSILISNKLNRYYPWTERPGRRLTIEGGLNLVNVLVCMLLVELLCYLFPHQEEVSRMTASLIIERNRGMLQWTVVSVMIAFMIICVNTGNYLLLNWKNEAVKAAELSQVAVEAELQALKLQIDPHFVFNNLSVLSELILENQQLGYQYAENFSKIYRYMLLSSKRDVIALEDELKFLHAYMFLIKHRFGDGVHFTISVQEDSRQLTLPPMTLQLLVENALKHNRTSRKQPLHIRIYNAADNEALVVENDLLPIEKILPSAGIGISNINRRYSLLSAKQPEIINTGEAFKVVLPLIRT